MGSYPAPLLCAKGAPAGQQQRQRKAGSLCLKAQTASLLLSAEQRYIKALPQRILLCQVLPYLFLWLYDPTFEEVCIPADFNQLTLFDIGRLVLRQVQLLAKNHYLFPKIVAFFAINSFRVSAVVIPKGCSSHRMYFKEYLLHIPA